MNLWCGRLFQKTLFVLAASIVVLIELRALDIPTFYRAPLFQGQPVSRQDNWIAYPQVRYVYADARKSFDAHSKTASLLSTHGFFDLGKLGVNVQTLKPLTGALWNPAPVTPATVPPSLTGEFAAGPNMPVEVSGRFFSHQFDLSWRQNILAGFFVEAYIPVKWVEIDNVTFVNKGEATVGKTSTINVDDFIKNQLDPILRENGFFSIKKPFKDSGFGDPIVCGGWQSETCTDVGFIDLVLGQLKVGLTLPLAEKRDIDQVFGLPLGNDGFWGVIGRGNIEVGLWNYFRVGASIGAEIFFTQERTERVATSKDQRGWIFLEKAKVEKDFGSIWDLLLYVQGREVIGALSVLLGVSYTTQERTVLSVRDDNYLKTFRETQKTTNNTIISQNDIANSNLLLASWDQYVVHVLCEYDLQVHRNVWFAPKFSFSCDIPVYGRRAFKANAFGGSMALMVDFGF